MEHQQVTKTNQANQQKGTIPYAGPALSTHAQAHPLGQFHQTIGNQAVQRLLRSGAIRAKLTVSEPGDQYEQEADRVAEAVMRMPDPGVTGPTATGRESSGVRIQRVCPECEEELHRQPIEEEEEETLQAKEAPGQTPEATQGVEAEINTLRGGGQPLSEPVRAFFEPRFGYDFSRVRTYTDDRANQSARTLNALAYAVGQDIFFGQGQYAPDTKFGQHLLAHELAHVVQQSGATTDGIGQGVIDDSQRQWENANATPLLTPEAAFHPGVSISPLAPAMFPLIQRQPGGGTARVVIGRAIRWLAGRGKTISRHVARHTRNIASRAVHSVFRTPNQVKKLVQRALSAPDNVLVQEGARRTRLIVEKEFGRAIGKNGETIIHIVLETTGKIVTAYPVRAFTAGGAAAGILILTLDEAAAEAREQLDTVEAEAQRRLEEAEPSFLEDLFLDIITFGLYGGSLNVGEDVELWADRQVREIKREACERVISAVEADELRSLEEDERQQICELVTVALGMPDLLDELDGGSETEEE
jgi:predicted RNA-binding protein YlqC (UPF0109 family)